MQPTSFQSFTKHLEHPSMTLPLRFHEDQSIATPKYLKKNKTSFSKRQLCLHSEEKLQQIIHTAKENYHFNDIQQHSFKLNVDLRKDKKKCKNQLRIERKDHSLQKKEPLKLFYNQKCSNITFAENSSKSLPIEISQNIETVNQNDQIDQFLVKHQSKLSKEISLSDEEHILHFLKNCWSELLCLKEKKIFMSEIIKIELILKDIIMQLSHQKLTENIAKVPEEKQNIQAFDFDACDEKIEMKKIMILLEEQQKHQRKSQKADDFRSIEYDANKLNEQNLMEGILSFEESRQEQKSNKSKKSFDQESSFNRLSNSESSGYIIFEVEKEGRISKEDKKIYLKSIIQKAKRNKHSMLEMNDSHVKQSPKDQIKSAKASTHKQNQQEISSHKQNQEENIFVSNSVQTNSELSSDLQYLLSSSKQYSMSVNDFQINKKQKQTMITLENQDQPNNDKRAVLNHIITMLNQKYNKNIKLEAKSLSRP